MGNFSLLDQLGQTSHRVLDGNRRIDPMNVVKIDAVDTEPLARGVAATSNVVRGIVDTPWRRTVGGPFDAALGGDLEFADIAQRAPCAQKFADQQFVMATSIQVSGVDQGHAAIGGLMQQLEGGDIVGRAVELTHSHGTKPKC
ncbi:hypothetical protein D3C71_1345820 [compost metagenome]